MIPRRFRGVEDVARSLEGLDGRQDTGAMEAIAGPDIGEKGAVDAFAAARSPIGARASPISGRSRWGAGRRRDVIVCPPPLGRP